MVLFNFKQSKRFALALGLVLAGATLQQAGAAVTDLAPVPVAGTGQTSPKPNVMLLMDTSRSMAFTHMPDEVETNNLIMPIGYRSSQCNALYYDPNRVYSLPKNAGQASLPTPSFNSARYNYYSTTDTSLTDLRTQFRAYDRNTRAISVATNGEDPPQAAYYYVYSGTATLTYRSGPCIDMEANIFPSSTNFTLPTVSANTTGGTWTRKLVTTAEQQNFAIWYTYYRTRMGLVKSSVSTAFAPLTDKFRMGFVSMNPLVDSTNANSGVSASKYLAIGDFTDAYKAVWYSKLYEQVPFESSPAREGLARVGRHYAGKMDGINKNMTPDPVQNSCQQNFTIMTTDGYWNTAAETVGPVGLDGTSKVGNMDGNLTAQGDLNRDDASQYSHRPIWDGASSGKRTDTNRLEQKRYQPCDNGEFFRSTSIIRQSTSQTLRRAQSLTRSTAQISISTEQTSKSTTQTQQTTRTETRQTLQALASTAQTTRSTRQELQTTTWLVQGGSRSFRTTTQNLQTTSYTIKAQTTLQQQTTRITQTTSRALQTQTQVVRTLSQVAAATAQRLRTDTTYFRTTSTTAKTTTQNRMTTTRAFEETRQLVAYNAATEQAVPVASCTNSSTITCITLTSGPTAVVSCTPQTAAPGNNYLQRTCPSPTVVGPTPVQSCSAATASAANNYTTTTCDAPTSTTTVVDTACTPATASSGNNWTTTSCVKTTTPEVQTASCTPGVSGNVTTACRTQVLSSNVPVQTCNNTTSGTTAITCTNNNTSARPVQSCTNTAASAGNNWTSTTCTFPAANNTSNVPVSSCSASGPTAPNWITTTCTNPPATNTSNVPVASCTASSPVNGNSFVRTTCTADATVASSGLVASCTPQTPDGTNSFIRIACTPVVSAWTTNASCVASGPTSTNGFTATACQNTPTMAATPVLPANCTAGTSGAVTTTCVPYLQTDEPVSACTPNTTGPVFVSCRTIVNGPTEAACTPGGGAGTNWVITTCSTQPLPNNNVGTCTPGVIGAITTTCTPVTQTVGVQPGSCAAQTGNAGNNWVTISCPAASTTGPTPVALNSCVNVAPSVGNAWTATTCTTTGPTVPAPVASCTSGVNPTTQVVTTCSNNNSAVAAVVPGSCTPQAATSGNAWIQTVCTPTSGTDTVNHITTTCNTARTGPTPVGACTPGTDANFRVTSCSTARTGPTQLPLASACANEAASAGNSWTSTTCTPRDVSAGVLAGTCTPSAPGVLPVITCTPSNTGPTAVASCTPDPGTSAPFITTTCSAPETTGPDRVTSCMAATPSAANGYQTTTCEPITGLKIQTKTQTLTTTYTVSGSTVIPGTELSGTPVETGWTDDNGGMCYIDPIRPPSIDLTPGWKQSTTDFPSGCTAWPCLGPVTGGATGGSSNSLADVAQYYYVTDLRPTIPGANPDLGKNDVPKLGSGIEDDRAPWQHMTTFVLGLGVSGTLDYQSDYKSALSGTFSRIRSYLPADLNVNWPVWPTKEPMDLPTDYNDPRSIDDFWHTAVNGRGKFFSAKDPDSVVQGLREALAGIEAQAGAGAGAATSNLTPVAGDNTAYTGSFTSSEWTGDLQAQDIDLETGNLLTTIKWSARSKLDMRTGQLCDNRKIYVREPGNTTMVNFTWNTKACDSNGLPTGSFATALPASMQTAYFNVPASKLSGNLPTSMSQYTLMTDGSSGSIDQRTIATGANLVNFLRGQRGREGFVPNSDRLYRSRTHVLGDIVNSQPTYVKAPNNSYQDTGYSAFVTAKADRTPMVYVGANDGMLHAFFAPSKTTDPNFASAGEEAWAFIPTAVMPNLYRLADTSYAEKHIFTVDGSPTVGDIFDSGANQWKTLLVGGLNSGGNGYYALDVTDPTAPKPMWEFNAGACASNPVGATADCNIGLTYGRPTITKLKNGKWVVMVTSGYNNVDSTKYPGADGKGYLYVLDAATGQIISRIGTGAGDTGTPSGLKDTNFFVSNVAYDNTALRVYGADILGNVWRFDVNDTIAPAGLEAVRLGTAEVGGVRQPITTRPELAEVNGTTMVLVATGRMLAISDLTDKSLQSVYAIKDPLGATSPVYSDLRGSLKPLKLVKDSATGTRTVQCASANIADCADTNGWFIDLPDGGERVSVDMQTVLGTLVFASNVPSDTLCFAGGYSWLNFVSLINGEAVPSSDGGIVSVPFFDNSVVVGMGLIGLQNGDIRALGRDATGRTRTIKVPVGTPPPVGKRISWREITR